MESIYRYTVVIEHCEEGGYFAMCPAFSGCHAEGETYEEALSEIKEVLKAFVEDYIAEGDQLPEDDITVTSVQVAI